MKEYNQCLVRKLCTFRKNEKREEKEAKKPKVGKTKGAQRKIEDTESEGGGG
jgi:hypothetical protein